MRAVFCGVLIICLLGCSSKSAQPVNTYLLPAMAETTEIVYKASMPVIILSPVSVDGLLGNQGIVYYLSPTEVAVARHHLWGESLSSQLFNCLLTGLRRGQTDVWVAPDYPQASSHRTETLMVNVNQFNGSFEGDAVMSGEWVLLDNQGNIAKSQSFNYREMLKADGYSALVGALSKNMNHLVADLSQMLAEK